MIYLDNAATTKPSESSIQNIRYILSDVWGNPSSPYSFGNKAYNLLDDSRKIIADSINALPEEIIFTSSSSESNNLALRGYNASEIYYQITSHPSIYECVKHIANIPTYEIQVKKSGKINKQLLLNIKPNSLVSIEFANSEIGTIQDIQKISNIVHSRKSILHVDATQAYGHLPINVQSLGIDLMTFNGHKFNCPKGVGVLFKRSGINIQPLIYGGHQENNLRAGTENLAYIYALAQEIKNNHPTKQKIKQLQSLTAYTYNEIINYCSDFCEITLNGHKNISNINNRLPGNLSITFHNIDAQYIITMLDLNNIYVSAGSACSSGDPKPSRVLKSIGLTDEEAKNTIRLSLSNSNTVEEINYFVTCLKKILNMYNK